MITDLCILLESAEITPALKKSVFSFNRYARALCHPTTLKRYTDVVDNLVGFD